MASTPKDPVAELDGRYGEPDVTATPWMEGRRLLEQAELFWLTTVRADGRPHVTPLIAVWMDNAMYFTTGPDEQKAKNLAHSAHCLLTTGCNTLREGFDMVVEGDAVVADDDAQLERLAAAYEEKYGPEWHFDVRDGAFQHEAGTALVFEVAPTTAYGFGKAPYSHTRWSF